MNCKWRHFSHSHMKLWKRTSWNKTLGLCAILAALVLVMGFPQLFLFFEPFTPSHFAGPRAPLLSSLWQGGVAVGLGSPLELSPSGHHPHGLWSPDLRVQCKACRCWWRTSVNVGSCPGCRVSFTVEEQILILMPFFISIPGGFIYFSCFLCKLCRFI